MERAHQFSPGGLMQRIRDLVTGPVTVDYFQRRSNEGWKLVAVEWTREAEEVEAEPEEIPYGYRIAGDCSHLEPDPEEVEILLLILEKVVGEWRAPQIAEELNRRGYRTRGQAKWTPSAVFDLLPRLIEAGPKLLKRPDWPERRQKLQLAR
jgi:hypothetical protein